MYFDNGEYCKRCHKLFYNDYSGKYDGLCPECIEYFEEHREEYLLFTGEYCKCKNCSKVEHYMFFTNDIGVCNDCMEKFNEKPMLKKWFHFRQRFTLAMYSLFNKIFGYLALALVAAVILGFIALWIAGMIVDLLSIDGSFLNEPRMKPDF